MGAGVMVGMGFGDAASCDAADAVVLTRETAALKRRCGGGFRRGGCDATGEGQLLLSRGAGWIAGRSWSSGGRGGGWAVVLLGCVETAEDYACSSAWPPRARA